MSGFRMNGGQKRHRCSGVALDIKTKMCGNSPAASRKKTQPAKHRLRKILCIQLLVVYLIHVLDEVENLVAVVPPEDSVLFQ